MMKTTICPSNGLLQLMGVVAFAITLTVPFAPNYANAQNAPTKPGTTVFSASSASKASTAPVGDINIRGSLPAVRPGEYEVAPIVGPPKGLKGVAKIVAARDREVVSHRESGRLYLLNDKVYLDGARLRVGQRLLAYSVGPSLSGIGQISIPTGILIIESAQPGVLAEARIERVFGEIKDEQELTPLVYPLTLPEGNTIPVYVGIRAKVVWVLNSPVLPSLQHYVVFNVGEKQGVKPGDQFTIMDETSRGTEKTPTAPVDVAVVKIVRVTPYGSSGIIIDNDQPLIKEGMFARMTARSR